MMFKTVLFAGLGSLFAASMAVAAEVHPFNLDSFHAAQAAGRPVLVDVH